MSTPNTRPLVIDLFCGGGAAAWGYHQAGYEVVGFDIADHPRYPFEFHKADFRRVFDTERYRGLLESARIIHASPPCQPYTHTTNDGEDWDDYIGKPPAKGKQIDRLITITRWYLERWSLGKRGDLLRGEDADKKRGGLARAYVIENVVGARSELVNPIMLCGTMFDLPIPRHRLFEVSEPISPPPHPQCTGVAASYARSRGWDANTMRIYGNGGHAGTRERWSQLMGIEHEMTIREIAEAIPPGYTRWIGSALAAS